MLDILLAILGLSLLVIVHESGHYLAARAFKMRVLRYSIGLGPALFRYRPRNSPTTFQVCAIPFLAYVQIAGMNPHEDVDPDDPEIYPNKGVFARIVTIAAGPVANYVAASVMVFVLALVGWPEPVYQGPMVVDKVEPGSPAAEAGLEHGDVIVEADGRTVTNVVDLQEITQPRAGRRTVYVIERDGERLERTITPMDRDGDGIIGVRAANANIVSYDYRPMPLGDAAWAGLVIPATFTVRQIEGLIDRLQHLSADGLMGPVGMGRTVAEHAAEGPAQFVLILVLISVALAIFNLLPIPALDGGRLVFLGYEVITRRRPNERFETAVHTVGILFLLGLLAWVTFWEIVG